MVWHKWADLAHERGAFGFGAEDGEAARSAAERIASMGQDMSELGLVDMAAKKAKDASDRALEAIEAHGCCDDYDETLRKIHLEQMILAMESGDTRTARTLAEAGDIDLEAETRLVLAELLLKSGQEKGAARQTVLAVQSNNESRRTMRQTISKRGTHMNVRQKSMISHARGLRAAVAGLDEDDAMADMGLGLDWAFDEKPDMLVWE